MDKLMYYAIKDGNLDQMKQLKKDGSEFSRYTFDR